MHIGIVVIGRLKHIHLRCLFPRVMLPKLRPYCKVQKI